jgi:hypothetical protein
VQDQERHISAIATKISEIHAQAQLHKDGWQGEKVDFHISALLEKKEKTKEKKRKSHTL